MEEQERTNWLNTVMIRFKELNPNLDEFYKNKRKEYWKTYRDKNTKATLPYVRRKPITFTKEAQKIYNEKYYKEHKEDRLIYFKNYWKESRNKNNE